MTTTVYIAGPMTGRKGYNFHAFTYAEKALAALGYEPINPARRGVVNGYTYEQYLRAGFRDLLDADEVCVLPGWQLSRGATREVQLAHWLGMPVRELTEYQAQA